MTEGLSDAEIAERLDVAPDTVVRHLGHALRALRVRSRLQLALWAAEVGFDRARRTEDVEQVGS